MAVLSESIVMTLWAAGMVAALVVLVAVLARGIRPRLQLAAGLCVALLGAGVITAPILFQAGEARIQSDAAARTADLAAERRALDVRRAELTRRATVPGSPLACLGALAGAAVEIGCEKTLFASATSVAVAVAYAAEQLQLLADGAAFAQGGDPGYAASLADLRRAAENDAYGIYAHVLATRDGCTQERCSGFALLRDVSTLKVHLRQRLYAGYVAQYRDQWGVPPTPVPTAPVAPLAAKSEPPAALDVPAAPAATTAAAPSAWMSTVTVAPLPKARPKTVMAARGEVETPPTVDLPVIDRQPAVNEPPRAPRAVVPPVASVLPNIDFPSASSIPPISIMAVEPKLPPESGDAAPSTAPARPAPQR